MMRPNTIHWLALGLAATLALDSAPISAQETAPPTLPTPAPAAPSTAQPTIGEAGGKVLGATPTTKRPTRKRRRRRRRARPLRLPAITQHGIPRLHLKAAYVIDATNNRVLFQKNQERVLPIASLTKLMTAMVFLETQPDWNRVIEMVPEDIRRSSRTKIRAREEITVRDLIHASLMSSDNAATKALVRTCGIPYEEFIRRMNLLADSLGVAGSHFVEPTGLSELNVSTAQDMARILRAATESEVVTAITQKTEYVFTTNKRVHHLVNTNRLLRSQWIITGGKTGFIRESGYCLVTNVKAPTGIDITAVLLGAPSNALRFAEARRILDWTFRFGLSLPEIKPETD